jgi:hypothetical protein
MKPRVLVVALVLIMGKPLSSQSVRVVHSEGCTPADRTDASDEISSEDMALMTSFLRELQSAVKEDRRDKVAMFMHYPLLVDLSNRRVHVRSAREFVAGYDRLFPVALRKSLLLQRPECIARVGAQGFTLGDVTIWFDAYPDGKVRIFTID